MLTQVRKPLTIVLATLTVPVVLGMSILPAGAEPQVHRSHDRNRSWTRRRGVAALQTRDRDRLRDGSCQVIV